MAFGTCGYIQENLKFYKILEIIFIPMKHTMSKHIPRRITLRILAFLVLAVCSIAVHAMPYDFLFTTPSDNGQLKDFLVNRIYKDESGFVWLGTGTTVVWGV